MAFYTKLRYPGSLPATEVFAMGPSDPIAYFLIVALITKLMAVVEVNGISGYTL
jgi:hypothetical protein